MLDRWSDHLRLSDLEPRFVCESLEPWKAQAELAPHRNRAKAYRLVK